LAIHDRQNIRGTFAYGNLVKIETFAEGSNSANFGISTYENGGIYEGEHLDGVPHGKGCFIYNNGDIYNGDVYTNLPHGIGEMKEAMPSYDNKQTIYKGEFKNGLYHGKGDKTSKNNYHYIGDFEHGREHGFGTETDFQGVFEGEFVRGRAINGKFTYENGDIYEGTFHMRKSPYGLGKMTYKNGDVYEGDWRKCDNMKGKMIYANGDVYDGEWDEKMKWHGYGELTMSSGEVHKGKFVEGKFIGSLGHTGETNAEGVPHGSGKLIDDDLSIYEGDFADGVPHGKGKRIFKSGNIESYEGEWLSGAMTGRGKIKYRNADSYWGEVKDGLPHGLGTKSEWKKMYYGYDVGDVEYEEDTTGRWENGEFVE
jgi:hypothetical protein